MQEQTEDQRMYVEVINSKPINKFIENEIVKGPIVPRALDENETSALVDFIFGKSDENPMVEIRKEDSATLKSKNYAIVSARMAKHNSQVAQWI